jgi:hypothetical protein
MQGALLLALEPLA